MSDFESIDLNGSGEFKFEFDNGNSLSFLEFELNFEDPVGPVIGVSFNEDSPFYFYSLSFFSDSEFKIDFEIIDVDIELMGDLG